MIKMKKVLITGGTSGIGYALVKKYLNNNYEVYTTYCHELTNKENNVNYLKLDLNEKLSIDNLVTTINEVDVLVCNAGICIDDDLPSKTYEDIFKVINTNLTGNLYLAKEIATKKMQMGSIVFVASDCGINNGYPEGIDYDASKAGIIKVSDDLAKYLAPNIRVNTVAPGWVDTKMNIDLNVDFKKEQISKILLDRFAKPEEIANVIYFLTSEEANYINAATIVVNGGLK